MISICLKCGPLNPFPVEVLRRFAADFSEEAQTALWKGCVTSIAQRCKRARNPRKNRLFKRRLENDDNLGPPSMAVGGGMQCEEQEENDDSQGESGGEDEDYELGSVEQPVRKKTPPLVRIPSDDDDQESSGNGVQDVVVCINHNKVHCVATQVKDSSARLESAGACSSTVEGNEPERNKQDIPPGIDPDITVVHLPTSSLQASVEPQTKEKDNMASPARRNSVASSSSDSNPSIKAAEESVTVKAVKSVSAQEPDDTTEKDASAAGPLDGDLLLMAQSIHKLGASPGSVTVSGIKMTPDCKCLYGGTKLAVISSVFCKFSTQIKH